MSKKSKAPLISLVKSHKARLDFKDTFSRFITMRNSMIDDYPEHYLFEDDDAYFNAWAAYGLSQGMKFNHRSPGYQKNGSNVIKKYLGNGVTSTVITKRGNKRHNHTPRKEKHLWEQGFVPGSIHRGSEDEVEVIDFTQQSSSGLLDNMENDSKAYDGIKIYFYKDYMTPNDVEEFDNLVDFDDFVTQEGIIIPEDVTLQILQSDVVYCSLDPIAWHNDGELRLIIEDSYGMLRWECNERASKVGMGCSDEELDVNYAQWRGFFND